VLSVSDGHEIAEATLAFAARIALTTSTSESSENAFERLFRAEYGNVARIAHRILSDTHAAEDVAQEVFVSFHRSHAPDSPFAAKWLYTAAAHTALNALRGRKRRERREFDDAADARAIARHDNPLETIESVERRIAVRRALGRINPRYATVLALRYAGLSYAEVANALGVDSGQVGTMLRRAEAALKKEFDYDPS
jgi:RNA polymerase sigma factor (sigma-70 family)